MIDTSQFKTRKVAYVSLGCKLNFAELSSLGKTLSQAGYQKVKPGEKADLCVINTCSVTETADKKSRQAIQRLVRQHPDAFVVVTGCYAQLKSEEVARIPGVHLVLGAKEKFDLPAHLEGLDKNTEPVVITSSTQRLTEFRSSCSREDRTRYFLKVQDGCDYFCTYCTIPIARGRSRNGSIALLTRQAAEIAAEGGREIVLTGVNIGDFGKTTGETFLELIQALDEVEGIDRFRISSIEPNLLTDEILEFIARSKRFAPHFHIPLQAGQDDLLRLMHRRYDTALFAHKVELIRQRMPNAFIGVDVITGSRGETDERFEQAFAFIEGLSISQLHVFSYSERPDTQALHIEHVVSPKTKKERHIRLQELSDRKWNAFYQSQQGRVGMVLFEHAVSNGMMHGFTEHYVRVEMPHQPEWINRIVPVVMGEWNDEGNALKGTRV